MAAEWYWVVLSSPCAKEKKSDEKGKRLSDVSLFQLFAAR